MKCNSWQYALTHALTDPEELLQLLDLDMRLLPKARAAAALFPFKVPRNFVLRMKKGDSNDPLLRQILPLDAELNTTAGFATDPLQEKQFNPIPGLLHKYHSRILLTLTGTCAINCRYCFRKTFNYEDNNPGNLGWQKALDYIAENKTLSEVILSGGDPLIANDRTLKNFTQQLTTLPHIKRLRLHSRIPIVLPERLTDEWIASVTHPALKTILVTHCNHPNELGPEIKTAITRLKTSHITVLNQSVLLKGVNDTLEALLSLSEALFDTGILPYYLHVLDKVQGTAHFDIDHDTASRLHWGMMQHLSGYLVPKLVCEQPGAPAKLPIKPQVFCTTSNL